MDLYEAMRKRRTIRKFKGPATEEQLNRIIAAGTQAPSAGNRQSWEFIIIDDPGLIQKVSTIKYKLNIVYKFPDIEKCQSPEQIAASQGPAQRESFANASLVMIYHRKKGRFQDASAWLGIENMSLAAVAEGLGSRIATFWGKAIGEINQLLHVPEEFKLAAALSIGVPAEEPVKKFHRPEGSWLHRNGF